MSTWFVQDNILFTTNYGKDKNKIPYIPFAEFLQDCAQVNDKDFFIKLTNDMVKDEIRKLPKQMFMNAIKIIKLFRDNYDEWKQIDKVRFASKYRPDAIIIK